MDVSWYYDQIVTSDSISSSSMAAHPSSKISADHSEIGIEAEAESKKLPSSKYRGVVPQPNGRWGSQIYEKHQRVWLGTFSSEEDAAKVYDIAAMKFRGHNAITNFRNASDSDEDYMEKLFLSSHSKAEIVDMLRKNTYRTELEQSMHNCTCHGVIGNNGFNSYQFGFNPYEEAREFLFQKVLTPSDVGKLNRMVIPKQQAEKHFALNTEIASKGVLLNFEDNMGNIWRLRYCYWSSSQSYVLTKGWSRFVKEKGLKAGDLVCFLLSNSWPNSRLFIECKPGNGSGSEEVESQQSAGMLNPDETISAVRLFGVNIFEKPNQSLVVDK